MHYLPIKRYFLSLYHYYIISDCDILDVVFLFDVSSDVSSSQFTEMIGASQALVEKWHGRVGFGLLHISALTYSDNVEVKLRFFGFVKL